MGRRLAAVGVATAALALPGAAGAGSVTLRFLSVTTVTQTHDRKPVGTVSKGDSIDFKDLLQNKVAQLGKRPGVPVGYDAGTVTYTSATGQRLAARATFPGVGTITYAGAMDADATGDAVLKITGGTGAFKGARGTVTIGSGTSKAPNTYRVTVPGTLKPETGLPVA
jgi:hypothetical protein